MFVGSADLGGADADFILDGLLLDCKATTKPARLGRDEINQLAGYLLLDYADAFGIRGVGLYLSRQGAVIDWMVDEFLGLLGARLPLAELRARLRRSSLLDHGAQQAQLLVKPRVPLEELNPLRHGHQCKRATSAGPTRQYGSCCVRSKFCSSRKDHRRQSRGFSRRTSVTAGGWRGTTCRGCGGCRIPCSRSMCSGLRGRRLGMRLTCGCECRSGVTWRRRWRRASGPGAGLQPQSVLKR